KPSMGWIYGLLLIVLMVGERNRERPLFRRLLAELAPAFAVFLLLTGAISLAYGPAVLLRTLLPFEGVSNYRALGFGLLAAGRELWDPSGLPWTFYLIDVSGLWIVGTLFLWCAAALTLRATSERAPASRRREILVTCAILH